MTEAAELAPDRSLPNRPPRHLRVVSAPAPVRTARAATTSAPAASPSAPAASPSAPAATPRAPDATPMAPETLAAPADPAGAPRPSWSARYRAQLVTCDVLVVVASAIWALPLSLLLVGESTPPTATVIPAIVVAAAVWIAALALFHTRDERLFAVGADEYKRMIGASTTAVGVIGLIFLSLDMTAPRAYLLATCILGIPLLLLGRWEWRRWLNLERRAGRELPRAVVVGDVVEVNEVIRRMSAKPAVYAVAGVALDAPGQRATTLPGDPTIPVVGASAEVVAAARRVDAQAVIVAGATSGGCDFVRQLSWQLEGTTIELVLATRLTEIAGPRIHVQIIDDLPLMHVDIPRFEGGKHLAKRALDIFGSSVGLVLLAPLLLAIAIAVHIDGPGGAIFAQERIGRGGRRFTMLKFRSMTVTAERDLAALLDRDEGNGIQFKLRNDPRVTAVGRVLRKYSLDELPQLWNVLVGDMSLVGPRPPLPCEVDGYDAHVRRRLYLKPGLTGPWQVSGRSDLDWEESVRLDLHYIENWSLIGDLMLLWRTVHVVLHPVGAY